MGFSNSDPEADTIKFGEAFVFVSAIFAYFFCREMALMPLDGVVQRNKLYIVSGETLFIKKLLNKYLNIIFEVLILLTFGEEGAYVSNSFRANNMTLTPHGLPQFGLFCCCFCCCCFVAVVLLLFEC